MIVEVKERGDQNEKGTVRIHPNGACYED